jgi:hypothetical protein
VVPPAVAVLQPTVSETSHPPIATVGIQVRGPGCSGSRHRDKRSRAGGAAGSRTVPGPPASRSTAKGTATVGGGGASLPSQPFLAGDVPPVKPSARLVRRQGYEPSGWSTDAGGECSEGLVFLLLAERRTTWAVRRRRLARFGRLVAMLFSLLPDGIAGTGQDDAGDDRYRRGMRSLLSEPWDRSSVRSWTLLALVGLLGGGCGLLIHRSRGTAPARAGQSVSQQVLAPTTLIRSGRPGLRVLFVGNSFTAANSMVAMVMRLAPRDRPILAQAYAPGASRLQNAADDPALGRLLAAARWNVVVLQEQSQLPQLSGSLTRETMPAVAKLSSMIRGRGAKPLLFETWGYRNGDPVNVADDSYRAMQTRLHEGYAYMAASLQIALAPVGDAWANALGRRPSSPLWQDDGKHPSVEGSYLTASVLTRVLTNGSNTTYTAGLQTATAAWLRHIAATTVARGR